MKRDIDILVYNSCNPHREEQLTRRVLKAIADILEEKPEPPKDAAYWPISIHRVSIYDDQLVVWWTDEVARAVFSWAYEKAWVELGDCRPVTHKLSEDLSSYDLPF